jgi:hypothetical protein
VPRLIALSTGRNDIFVGGLATLAASDQVLGGAKKLLCLVKSQFPSLTKCQWIAIEHWKSAIAPVSTTAWEMVARWWHTVGMASRSYVRRTFEVPIDEGPNDQAALGSRDSSRG